MKNRVINIISICAGIIILILLIKVFYFDTRMGFNIEILELNYSAFPMYVDVIICILFCPFLCYGIVQEFLEWITDLLYVR